MVSLKISGVGSAVSHVHCNAVHVFAIKPWSLQSAHTASCPPCMTLSCSKSDGNTPHRLVLLLAAAFASHLVLPQRGTAA